MKKKPFELEAFIKQGGMQKTRIYLFFGQDEGRVRALSDQVYAASQPAEKRILLPKAVSEGEVLLADEMAATSLFGDSQCFILQGASDSHLSAIEMLEGIASANILILQGSDSLNSRSKLVQYADAAPNIVCIACYQEEGQNLKKTLATLLQQEGLQPSPGALQLLSELVDSDYHIVRSEVTKLALYKGGSGPITEDDVLATASSGVVEAIDELVNAVYQSEIRNLEQAYYRLLDAKTPLVPMLRALTSRAQQLQQLHAAQDAGRPFDQSFRSLRLHFRQESAVRRQLGLWSATNLKQALNLLWKAERDSRLHAAANAPSLMFRHFADVAKLVRRG